jgi:hypothetical protein
MYLRRRIDSSVSGLLPWMMIFFVLAATAQDQSNTPAPPVPITQAHTNASDEMTKAITVQLQMLAELQAKQQAALEELKQSQKELNASLAANSSNHAAQLVAVSKLIDSHRAQDLNVIRNSQRVALAIVIGLVGVLLVSILFLSMTSIRAINRLTTILSNTASLPQPNAQALAEAREAQKQLLLFPGERGPHELGSALVQLHQRIQSLENLAGKTHPESKSPEAGATGVNPPKAGNLPATSAAQ